jgi:hypothetical protein
MKLPTNGALFVLAGMLLVAAPWAWVEEGRAQGKGGGVDGAGAIGEPVCAGGGSVHE